MLNMGLGFVFTARDLASAKMSQLERRFTKLDDCVTGGTDNITASFRQLGLGLGVFTAGAVTVAGAFALADMAGRFEQSIAAVAAVSGATTAELDLLKNAAIDAGIATQFSPTEAAGGLRELAQAGFNAQESIQLLRPVLDLAAGSLGELSPQAAAGLAAQAMKSFGLSLDDASISVDRMLQAVNVFALSADELPLALGTASRGAQTMNQSLSETLIALGLVKNVIPGVERASTAVSVAMERMADPEVQQQLRGIGVAVVDSQGNFRQFLDVLGDMAPTLDRMTESQRAAFLTQTFGREALGGFNAILTQVTSGIRTNTGETLKGGEAIAYLRQQFENAGGTAAAFREKMLNTFAGQKQLLRGSLETLAIVLGEPFAQALKPVVTAVVDALNGLIKFFRSMPSGVKKAFATFVIAAGSITALVGAVIAAKASISLLVIGFKALGLSMSGVISTALPAVLVVGLIGAAIAGLRIAFEKNLGGLGDLAKKVGDKIQLFFSGLKQLFEQGGFSDAVREELGKAENQGLKQFLVRLYQIAYRIGQIWEGFTNGFTSAIEAAQPWFRDLADAFAKMGDEIATVLSSVSNGAAGLPTEGFRSFGATVGVAIGIVVSAFVGLLAIFTRIVTGISSGVRKMLEIFGPTFKQIGMAFDHLVATWRNLWGETEGASGAVSVSTDAWTRLGNAIGHIVGGIVTFIALAIGGLFKVIDVVLWIVTGIKDIFVTVGTAIGEGLGAVVWFLTEDLPKALSIAWDKVTGFFTSVGEFFGRIGTWFTELFGSIAESIKSFFQPVVDFFQGVWDALQRIVQSVGGFFGKVIDPLPDVLRQQIESRSLHTLEVSADQRATPVGSTSITSPSVSAIDAMPARAEAKARSSELDVFASKLEVQRKTEVRLSQPPPFTVNVQVDGETIARAVNNAQQSSAARAFSPVPVY